MNDGWMADCSAPLTKIHRVLCPLSRHSPPPTLKRVICGSTEAGYAYIMRRPSWQSPRHQPHAAARPHGKRSFRTALNLDTAWCILVIFILNIILSISLPEDVSCLGILQTVASQQSSSTVLDTIGVTNFKIDILTSSHFFPRLGQSAASFHKIS